MMRASRRPPSCAQASLREASLFEAVSDRALDDPWGALGESFGEVMALLEVLEEGGSPAELVAGAGAGCG